MAQWAVQTSLFPEGLQTMQGVFCPLHAALLSVWVKRFWEGYKPHKREVQRKGSTIAWFHRIPGSLPWYWMKRRISTGSLSGTTLTCESNFFPGTCCVLFFLGDTPWVHKSSFLTITDEGVVTWKGLAMDWRSSRLKGKGLTWLVLVRDEGSLEVGEE